MTSISDQIAAIRAQLDEDERVAKAASPGPWNHANDGLVWAPRIGDPVSGSTEIEDAEHIARWNPARVLSEIKIKRGLVALAEEMLQPAPEPPSYPAGARTIKGFVDNAEASAAVVLIKILAADLRARLAADCPDHGIGDHDCIEHARLAAGTEQ